MPPIVSMKLRKPSKSMIATWSISIPSMPSTVLIASLAPPEA